MSEVQIEAPARKRTTKKRRPRQARAAEAPKKAASPFAGITATKCCDGCVDGNCLISTVNVCKHPYMTSDSGCGPITMANRNAAKKLIKHERIDAA